MTDAINAITIAEKEVEKLTIADKELVNTLLMSARRNVQIQLDKKTAEGFKEAVDTMDKVKAIEDYIKRKRGQGRAELVTQNMVAAERLRIVRDIGDWLGMYLLSGRPKEKVASDGNLLYEEQLYKLEQLEINEHQSSDWQKVAGVTEYEFTKWLDKFLDSAEKSEIELYLKLLLLYAKGKEESTPIESLTEEEEYRKYYFMFFNKCDSGNMSKIEFTKRKDDWIATQQYIENNMRQRGELF
jgi:hypothetical protein